MQAAWEEFKAMTDPVAVWLEQNIVTGANAWVPKSALIAAYNKAAEEAGRAGLTAQAFGRAIKRARPDVGEAQRTVSGRQVKCYTGLGLRGGDDPGGGGSDPDGGNDPKPEGSGQGTTATTDTTDSTNCYGFKETLQEQGEGEGSITQNKQERENGSNGSKGSSGWFGGYEPDRKYRAAAELLEDPPEWLAKQLTQYRANPGKLYKPTAAAMSQTLYDTTERWQEVGPALEAYLERVAKEEDYEEL